MTGPLWPAPQARDHARRRAALSAAFPGETLVIPTGTAKVRANDQFYPFRPGSDFVYLTGDHDPDGVLIMRPDGDGHDAVLYTRPPYSAGREEFFWGLMAGRPRELADKTAELGVQTAAMAEAEDALARCACLYPGAARHRRAGRCVSHATGTGRRRGP